VLEQYVESASRKDSSTCCFTGAATVADCFLNNAETFDLVLEILELVPLRKVACFLALQERWKTQVLQEMKLEDKLREASLLATSIEQTLKQGCRPSGFVFADQS